MLIVTFCFPLFWFYLLAWNGKRIRNSLWASFWGKKLLHVGRIHATIMDRSIHVLCLAFASPSFCLSVLEAIGTAIRCGRAIWAPVLQSQLKTGVIAWVPVATLVAHLIVSGLFLYRIQLGVVGAAITMSFLGGFWHLSFWVILSVLGALLHGLVSPLKPFLEICQTLATSGVMLWSLLSLSLYFFFFFQIIIYTFVKAQLNSISKPKIALHLESNHELLNAFSFTPLKLNLFLFFIVNLKLKIVSFNTNFQLRELVLQNTDTDYWKP